MTPTTHLSEPAQLDPTRLGREGFVQRLLSGLILGADPPGWNKPATPSTRGAKFIEELDSAWFGSTRADVPAFVDEYELPARDEDECSGWPDYGVVWSDRLLLIELKTEKASHRAGQLPHYRLLARHHHPAATRDLVYVTPPMPPVVPPEATEGERYRHVVWRELTPLIEQSWGDTRDETERRTLDVLLRVLDDIEEGRRPSWPTPAPKVTTIAAGGVTIGKGLLDDGLRVAALVEDDGKQRALDVEVTDPAELDEIRLSLRNALRAGPTIDGRVVTHVRPWLWRTASSGAPMTRCGDLHGYEIRLSRYAEVW